jgi:hypothetical protein
MYNLWVSISRIVYKQVNIDFFLPDGRSIDFIIDKVFAELKIAIVIQNFGDSFPFSSQVFAVIKIPAANKRL